MKMSVLLDTTFGSITIDLFTASAPRASLNFLKLCKLGAYRGCLFFNVQQGFVAQTGDPTGTGRAGSSVYGHLYGSQARLFEPEVRSHLRHARRGTVSMVPSAGGGHGSQFLVTLADGCASLDGRATVFGEVVQEGDTWPPALAALNAALCDEAGRPFVDARVLRAHVLVDPFDDPPGLAALLPPPGSPPWRVPPSETVAPRLALNDAAAAAAEAEEAAAGRALSAEERAARARARAEEEARSRAVLLEMVGDLPTADVKPPDTALFVCKLNPVTTAKDLTQIFARFGDVTSCDVVKDPKTGESLCYAFLSFAKASAAEAAYLKMDNVLIDDRRIRVDFSQSVAKVWNAHRRGEAARPLDGGSGPRARAPRVEGSGGGGSGVGGAQWSAGQTAGGDGSSMLVAALDRLRERGVAVPAPTQRPLPAAAGASPVGGAGAGARPPEGEGGAPQERRHHRDGERNHSDDRYHHRDGEHHRSDRQEHRHRRRRSRSRSRSRSRNRGAAWAERREQGEHRDGERGSCPEGGEGGGRGEHHGDRGHHHRRDRQRRSRSRDRGYRR